MIGMTNFEGEIHVDLFDNSHFETPSRKLYCVEICVKIYRLKRRGEES